MWGNWKIGNRRKCKRERKKRKRKARGKKIYVKGEVNVGVFSWGGGR
jgi:hypothetical protein